jgi:hypothetical protein
MSVAARFWQPWFSPLGSRAGVGAKPVQEALRKAFAHWGLPARVRIDNGTPWGATGGLPTALMLWLIGLGVGATWNPPREPRKNAVVERFQGVGQNWLEPETCSSADELQLRAEASDRLQREEYPAIGGQTRMKAFPGLKHSGRLYRRRDEARQWALTRVLNWLSEHAVPRLVNRNGKVSLYDRDHWIGRHHIGKQAWVTLDPDTTEWVIMDENGAVLKRVAATELCAERICALSVSRDRGEGGQT